ncbi:Protein kinase-like domain [Ceraceosorus bombacis]|uniref:Protein kinase-like domain n=1 Tax=Ceraceosorus bombacis TaxID=401625 RepID=A0A0N7LA51_9BASI|nr:Protein kinase-like domain [Ceraceosorus bombacis]
MSDGFSGASEGWPDLPVRYTPIEEVVQKLERTLRHSVEQQRDGGQEEQGVRRFRMLNGGLTNRACLLTLSRARLVVRLLDPTSAELLSINRHDEVSASRHAATLGISPELLLFIAPSPASFTNSDDAEHVLAESQLGHSGSAPKGLRTGGAMVLRHVDGSTLANQDVQDLCSGQRTSDLMAFVEPIARLHLSRAGALESPSFCNEFVPRDARVRYLRTLHKVGGETPPGYLELLPKLKVIEDALEFAEDKCPCHNDLLAANFIRAQSETASRIGVASSGGIRCASSRATYSIIDWELSGLGWPSFELGNLASECELNLEQTRHLVDAYWQAVEAERADSSSSTAPKQESLRQQSRLARARLWGISAKLTWVAWGCLMRLRPALEHQDGRMKEHEKDENLEEWIEIRFQAAREFLKDHEDEVQRLCRQVKEQPQAEPQNVTYLKTDSS